MGKVRTIQNSMNGGELSPRLRGRTEIPRYLHGLEQCRNALPLAEGGAIRRPGTRYVAPAAKNDVRLIPFKITSSGAVVGWVLEFTDDAIRFFSNGAQILSGGNPYSIVSPYQTADLAGLRYEQNENTLYIFHENYSPYIIERVADDNWTITALMDIATLYDRFPFNRPSGTTAIQLKTSAQTGNVTVTASANFFVAGHVGVVFLIHDGYVKITAITNPTTASATIYGVVGSLSYDAEWTETAWSNHRGWPRAGTFFEQRLILAGSKTYPNTVWGSTVGVYLSDAVYGKLIQFYQGANANDPFSFTCSEIESLIQHLSKNKSIYAFSAEAIITIDGAADQALTSSTPDIKVRAEYNSSSKVRPLKIGNTLYFASATGKRFRSIEYSLERDNYYAPNLALFASHMLDSYGLQELVYCAEPNNIAWAITAGGKLISITIEKEQDVAAWAQHPVATDAIYKSIAAIPKSTGEAEVWLAVTRTVNGSTVTYIEYIDYTLNTDSALTASATPAKTTWTGFDHLEGKTVDVVADGYDAGTFTVTSGDITLPYPAAAVQVGLNYITTIKDLPLDLAQQGTSVQGSNMAVGKIRVRLLESAGCTVNGERIALKRFGPDLLDTPAETFTGDKVLSNLNRSTEPEASQVTIIQDRPLPLTVLAIIKQVAIND